MASVPGGVANNEGNQRRNNGCRDRLTVKKTAKISQPAGNSASAEEVRSRKAQQWKVNKRKTCVFQQPHNRAKPKYGHKNQVLATAQVERKEEMTRDDWTGGGERLFFAGDQRQ